MAHDLELRGHTLEDLADVLTQAAQLTSALRTDTAWRVHDLFARQMCRQRPAHRCAARRARRLRMRWVRKPRLSGFELFEAELELGDALIELFRGAPKVHTA